MTAASTAVTVIGTYLPPWDGGGGTRRNGRDEDALTMAVEAGRAALSAAKADVRRVVFVSRDLPLLDGGNAAALLSGLGLGVDIEMVEQIGGAPAVLDAITSAPQGTLVLGADVGAGAGAGAGAALVVGAGGSLSPAARLHRSLPVRLRTTDGRRRDEDDPRLLRDRGLRASLDRAALPAKPVVIAGTRGKDADSLCEGDAPWLPTTGASAVMFALAAAAGQRRPGIVAAVEQATLCAALWAPDGVTCVQVEAEAQPWPNRTVTSGMPIKVALTAYERAFDSKLRWMAGQCSSCGLLAFPERHRCLGCGVEARAELVALPRTATIYTLSTIHVAVPGLASPYTLAVVELDDVGVRALVTVTDVAPGTVHIGDRGRLLLRLVSDRDGVPDYGYAFSPDSAARPEPAPVVATSQKSAR